MLKENIFLLEKQRFILDSHRKHFAGILQLEKFRGLLQLEVKGDFVQKAFRNFALSTCNQMQAVSKELNKMKKNKKSKITTSMQEYLLKSKLMIWKDKYNLLKIKSSKTERTLMITLLYQILVLELILTKKEQIFYWNTHCLNLSEKLSSLIETDYLDLDSICLKPSLKNQEVNSSFLTTTKLNLLSKNLQKTSYQSYISSLASKWENGVTKTENVKIKTLKFKIHPNKEQIELIKNYANCFKYVYNKTINRLKKEDYNSKISKIDLRNELVTEKTRKHSILWNKCNSLKNKLTVNIRKYKSSKSKSLKDVINFILDSKKLKVINNQYNLLKLNVKEKIQTLTDFEKRSHKDIRTIAVNEAFTSWRTNADLILKHKKDKFTMKYKTKKTFKKSFTFGISPAMFRLEDNSIYMTDRKLKNNKIRIGKKSSKSLSKINCVKQAEILYRKNQYYIHLYVCLKNTTCNTKRIKNMIGLDLGSATFLSGYSPDQMIKYQQSNLLNTLNQKLDKIKESKTKLFTRNNRVKNKKRVLNRIECKKINIVDNMHWRIINDLCKNYDVICLERFNSSKCVKNNNLSKFSKRNLNDLKHFQFRQRLKFKAENQGVELILVNPYLTSKYCSSCGNVKYDLDLKERIYNCSKCNLSLCRDINACKNMLMFGIGNK